MTLPTFEYRPQPEVVSSWERQLGVSGGPLDLMEQIESGIPARAFDRFSAHAGVSRERLAAAIHTTTRTVARRKESGKPLDQSAGERLVRLALLYRRADEILGDEALTREWMLRPRAAFGGRSPFDMAASEIGAQEVEDLLLRAEHGVFY